MKDIAISWFNKQGDYRDKELGNMSRKKLLKLQAAIQEVLDTKPSPEQVQLGAVDAPLVGAERVEVTPLTWAEIDRRQELKDAKKSSKKPRVPEVTYYNKQEKK